MKKGIIFFNPIDKKWQNWKNTISGIIKFSSKEEALKEFKKQQSVKNGIITKFKAINL